MLAAKHQWGKVNSVFLLCLEGDTRRKRKIGEITQALSVSPVDVATLRRMAISEGGLLTDEIRCQVWPWLLNVPPQVLEQEPGTDAPFNMEATIPHHPHIPRPLLFIYLNCDFFFFMFF